MQSGGTSPPAKLGTLQQIGRRSKRGLGLAECSSEVDIRAFVRSACWDLFSTRLHYKYVPAHYLAKYNADVVQPFLHALPIVKPSLCTEGNSALWCHKKVVRWVRRDVLHYTKQLRKTLAQQSSLCKLYVQPTGGNALNVVRRRVEVSSAAEKGGRASMEDYTQVIPHLANVLSDLAPPEALVVPNPNHLGRAYRTNLNNSQSIPESAASPPQQPSPREGMLLADERRLHPLAGIGLGGAAASMSSADNVALDRTARLSLMRKWAAVTDTYCGVFDGHLGAEAAKYVKTHLHENICNSAAYPTDVKKAIKEGFEVTNDLLLARARDSHCKAGTTATICITKGDQYYIANVGDSSAVLFKRPTGSESENKKAKSSEIQVLSTLHHVSNKDEWPAVQARGGVFVSVHGGIRLDGQISVTRTMGFITAAEHMSAEPDIVSGEITPEDDFIVLASDGLWDVMSHTAVCDFIRAARAEVNSIVLEKSVAAHEVSVHSAPSPIPTLGDSTSSAPSLWGCEADVDIGASLMSTSSVSSVCSSSSSSSDDSSCGALMSPAASFRMRARVAEVAASQQHSADNVQKCGGSPLRSPLAACTSLTSDSDAGGTDSDDDVAYMDYSIVSEALVSEAVSLGATDNVSAIVVFFNPIPDALDAFPQEP